MKQLVKTLVFGLFVFGMANCSSGGGGGGEPAQTTPNANLAKDANQIVFSNDEGDSITWMSEKNDIYRPSVDKPSCDFGLSEGADDDSIAKRMKQLESILEKSEVGKGSNDKKSGDSHYLTIYYKDGKKRVFNLENKKASKDEEILSNGDDIIDFFYDIEDELNESGQNNCPTGKGDK